MTSAVITIGDVSDRKIPEHIRSDFPGFSDFLKAYYEYLDNELKEIKSARDLDSTTDDYIEYFKKELFENMPAMLTDEKKVIRHIRDFYLSKGSEESFKFLFRVLFNKSASLSYPKEQLFTPSSGKWIEEKSLMIKTTSGNIQNILNNKITVTTADGKNHETYVNAIKRVKVRKNGYISYSDDIHEVFVEKNFSGDFKGGDAVIYIERDKSFAGELVNSITTLEIINAGKNFRAGETYEISHKNGYGLKVRVAEENEGEIKKLSIINFGLNYEENFYHKITSITDQNAKVLSDGASVGIQNVILSDSLKEFNETLSFQVQDYAEADYFQQYSLDENDHAPYVGEIIRTSEETTSTSELTENDKAHILFKISALLSYTGFFANNRGFLSNFDRIQDSKYYQKFSYVVKVNEALDNYKSILKRTVHPAGTELFSEYEVLSELNINMDDISTIIT